MDFGRNLRTYFRALKAQLLLSDRGCANLIIPYRVSARSEGAWITGYPKGHAFTDFRKKPTGSSGYAVCQNGSYLPAQHRSNRSQGC